MDNNSYAQSSRSPFPYAIEVKQFSSPILCLPKGGTIARSHPDANSSAVYVFSDTSTSTTRHPITQLVFCNYAYWVKIPYLGNNLVTGYVKCSDIGFDYGSYVDPAQQTPNSQIGTNTDVIFNMWYFPNSKYKGVNYATPLYYQLYSGGGNSYKCTLLSSISGLYKYEGIYLDPTTYLKEMTARYWASGGIHTWPATMKTTDTKDKIRKIAKENLNKKMPILVGAGAGAGKLDHMVLVVGYKNCGINLSDYLVLDSVKANFSTLQDFFNQYSEFPTTWGTALGKGYVYGEYSEYQN